MEPISLMGILVIATKGGLAILSIVGITSSVDWMNKKMFLGKPKKGDGHHDDESELRSQKLNRHDL